MRIGALFALTVAIALSASFPANAQTVDGPKVEWNHSTWGKSRAFTAGMEKVSQIVSEKTGGKFTIKIHYGEALSKDKENLDGIKLGAFEMADFCNFYNPGKVPAWMVLTMPFLPLSDWNVSKDVREATNYEGRLETRGKQIGTTFEAVYDPANPNDVRATPNLSSVGYHLAMLFGGLGAVGLSLLPQMLGLFGAGGRREDAPCDADAKDTDARAWGEDALKDAIARNQATSQRVSAAAAGNGFGRRQSAMNEPRRQFGMRGS